MYSKAKKRVIGATIANSRAATPRIPSLGKRLFDTLEKKIIPFYLAEYPKPVNYVALYCALYRALLEKADDAEISMDETSTLTRE